MPGKAYIGTSGWNYKSWRDGFYGHTPQKQWLRFCAERFTGIEVNGTFYKLPEKTTFKKWREATPEDFPFAIKGHRYVTHNKKLIDVEESVIRCRDAASPLGTRLAAVVWQLPASLKKDLKRLKRFVKILRRWKKTRHVIEFRHELLETYKFRVGPDQPRVVTFDTRAAQFPSVKLMRDDKGVRMQFPGTEPTRPVSPKLSDLADRRAWMDKNGIDHQLVGGWLDIFGYAKCAYTGGNVALSVRLSGHPERSRDWSVWGAATWTGRPEAERSGSERIKSRGAILAMS